MKTNAILGTICVVLVIVLGIFWIKSSSVQAPTVDSVPPISDDITLPVPPTPTPTVACEGIQVTSPVAGSHVTFPLTITGIIHPTGNIGTPPWVVFEANAGTVRVKNTSGIVISPVKPIHLTVDWMNTNPKPFSVTIPSITSVSLNAQATLYFVADDPSGDGHPKTCSIPVVL